MEKILKILLCAYIIILPIIPVGTKLGRFPVSGDLILAFIIVVYVTGLLLKRELRESLFRGMRNIRFNYMEISMLLLLLIMFLSTFYAKEKMIALAESMRFLTYIILYIVIKYGLREKKSVHWILKSYLFIVALLSLIGIFQFFTGFGLNPKFIEEYKFGIGVRIASTLENPNAYSAFLSLSIFPVLMLSVHEKSKKKRGIYLLISLLVFINLALTFSRNAILAYVIGCVLLSLLYNWKYILFLIGPGGVALLIPSIKHRVLEFADYTQNFQRIYIYEIALKMIKEHFFFGVGNGNFVSYYDEYTERYNELAIAGYHRYPTHNSYLKVFSELGILGFLAFISFIFTAMLRMKQSIDKMQDSFIYHFYRGAFVSLFIFLTMNLFDNLFFIPKVTTYFWVFIAISEFMFTKTDMISIEGGSYGK